MRAEPSCGINVLFSLLLIASGVSAQSHSASPHLLRTKRSFGSSCHKAVLQGHQIWRQ